ncbi:pectinesterase family protein [Streptomyces sp. NBC_00047]|uniref:pectinesterase family protein n=1 Tax=Streptomyces sp. NBC_00047 TaxID=2975627 RepID=UPI00225314EB|nr:pectinesterase family protein [Streptomyces sp. NBC_00047]MCX5609425.1 pectinesterase family protein [Streptomyces sp. NBC_00047]
MHLTPGYSLDSYLKAYDPAVWGRAKVPSGAQEDAHRAAQARQAARMVFTVPARTTVIGVPGTGAGSGNLVGGAPVDLVAAHNDANPGKKIKTTVGWKPTLTAGLEPAAGLPAKLAAKAGAGVLTETGGKAPAPSGPAGDRTLTVAADGSAAHRSVQAAVDAATAGDTVLVARGTYRETVNVPASKHGLTLKGATGNAEDVVITYDNASGTPKPGGGTNGTAGGATAAFSANDITVTGVTVENTWERSAHPDVRDTQVVAVSTSTRDSSGTRTPS